MLIESEKVRLFILNDFKEKYLKYKERYDIVLFSRGDYFDNHQYKVYDKYDYDSKNSIFGLSVLEAKIVMKCLNDEDAAYLKEIYHYTSKINQK